MTMGVVNVEDDQQVRQALVVALGNAAEEDVAEVVRRSTLHWWTDLNEELGVALGDDYAAWYPAHFATLIVPAGTYGLIADNYDVLVDALATALGTDGYMPLRSFTICEEPEPVRGATPAEVPMQQRGRYSLTPIEAAFYDELCETDLTFTVQTTIHSAGETRRPDFIVYPDGRPMVVELDGHDYHHTREQRTADAKRERWLAARGFDFIRFTGSEVSADAQACVRELRDTIRRRQREPEYTL